MSSAAGLLQGAHALLAWRGGPHWLLSESDARAYGQAWCNALRHLPLAATQKGLDFAALVLAIGAFEGPRVAITLRNRHAAKHPPQPVMPGMTSFHFTPPGNGAAETAH